MPKAICLRHRFFNLLHRSLHLCVTCSIRFLALISTTSRPSGRAAFCLDGVCLMCLMRLVSTLSATGLLLVVVSTSQAMVRPHHHSSAHALVRHTESRRNEHIATEHVAPVGMSPDRATAIQTALIQKGYLAGEPTGTWDLASVDAMQKLQGDNGWQTKFVPDARALIKLGLGANSTPAPTAPVMPTTTIGTPATN